MRGAFSIEAYAKYAAVWDWDGFDQSPEYAYWCEYAKRFGDKVLLPMCALGQAGVYMAERGFAVTAVDFTPEMIEEGKKRFDAVQGLSFQLADITALDLDPKDFDFAFLATQDLHLLPDAQAARKAFVSLAGHLRPGGCLALELILPSAESYEYPTRTFHPRVPHYTDRKVWKDGKGRYDAVTKRHHIDQVVYVQDEQGTESFEYSIILQYFDRAEILEALEAAGFAVAGEYRNRDREPWIPGEEEWIIEAIKR